MKLLKTDYQTILRDLGVLPSGNNGSHFYQLDINFNIEDFVEDDILTCIYDKRRALEYQGHLFEEKVQYQDGILTFEWKAPERKVSEGIKTHIIRDNDLGIILVAKQDPRTARLSPCIGMAPDNDTLEFFFRKKSILK